MVIVCEGCGARFRMRYALFQDAKGARIRCRKCGSHIEVRHTPEPDSSPPDEQATPPVSASIEAESEIVPIVEAEPEPVAEAHEPAELEPPVEAQADIPTLEPGDTVPEEEPTHAQPAPWMETVPLPDAPDAAPAGEPEAAMAHTGNIGRRDIQLEELFLRPVGTGKAPEPDFSREGHAAERASLKRRPGASHRRGPSMLTILLLVVPGILLLAGGAFFFRDTKSAQELLRDFFPPSGSGNATRTVSVASVVEKPAYEIRDVKSSYAKTFIGGNLFVIQGTVANVGKGPSRGIRVQATLLGKDNQALANNTVFAANLVDNTTLRHSNRAVIEGFLGDRYGERNVNRDIPAGKSLPFMVVFFDPPGQLEYFTVKALDAE
jgi:DNA-directed RNA polymerase subunit RPC12/RpoP